MLTLGKHRFRLVGRRIVSDSGPAPIRAVLEAQGAALALFSKAEQKEIVGAAIAGGAEWYILTIVPLLFGPYAKTHGYQEVAHRTGNGLFAHENKPLVYNGYVRRSVLEGTDFEIKKTGANVSARIVFPLPANDHGVVYGLLDRSQVAKVLRTITAEEVRRVAVVVGKTLAATLASRPPPEIEAPASRDTTVRQRPTGTPRARAFDGSRARLSGYDRVRVS